MLGSKTTAPSPSKLNEAATTDEPMVRVAGQWVPKSREMEALDRVYEGDPAILQRMLDEKED